MVPPRSRPRSPSVIVQTCAENPRTREPDFKLSGGSAVTHYGHTGGAAFTPTSGGLWLTAAQAGPGQPCQALLAGEHLVA